MSSKIYSLIPKIMADLGHIGKEKKNTHQGYSFRGIEDMYNSIQPVLVKHGVFVVPQVVEQISEHYGKADGKVSFRIILRVNHKFYADDGSFVEVITSGEGIDTSDKASNKAMSAAMKYAFIELLSIPTLDVSDSDRDTPEVESPSYDNFNNQAPPTKPQPPKSNGFGPRAQGAKQ